MRHALLRLRHLLLPVRKALLVGGDEAALDLQWPGKGADSGTQSGKRALVLW